MSLVVLDMTKEIREKLLRDTEPDDELQQLSRTILYGWPGEPNTSPSGGN
jgi:hypothetical protein